jgi:hypothetical protein
MRHVIKWLKPKTSMALGMFNTKSGRNEPPKRAGMADHVGRFGFKVSIAALIACIIRHDNFLFAFSFWVFAYAAFAVLYALMNRERMTSEKFTCWDEAMWLGAIGAALNIASKVV